MCLNLLNSIVVPVEAIIMTAPDIEVPDMNLPLLMQRREEFIAEPFDVVDDCSFW